MKRIFKYRLDILDMQVIGLPEGAEILSVANQDETLCIWAIVDPDTPRREYRTIHMRGTGQELDKPEAHWEFLGTVLMMHDSLVWHVFIEA